MIGIIAIVSSSDSSGIHLIEPVEAFNPIKRLEMARVWWRAKLRTSIYRCPGSRYGRTVTATATFPALLLPIVAVVLGIASKPAIGNFCPIIPGRHAIGEILAQRQNMALSLPG